MSFIFFHIEEHIEKIAHKLRMTIVLQQRCAASLHSSVTCKKTLLDEWMSGKCMNTSRKKSKKKMMGIKGVVLLLFVLIMTLVYLVASKEAVFIFVSVETQRVFAR